MGYTQHRFFIVHSWETKVIEEARKLALETFETRLVGPVMHGVINDTSGFIVWTSGSQIGWPEDDDHQADIASLIEKMSKMNHPPSWCRVDSGNDTGDLSAENGHDGNWTHEYKRFKVPNEG